MKISTKFILAIAAAAIIAVILVAMNNNNGSETIIVAVDENPPYTYTTVPSSAYFDESGPNAAKSSAELKFQGFDIDVLNAVAKRAGLKIEYREVGFAETLEQMKHKLLPPKNFIERYRAKKTDLDLAIGGISITDDRKKFAEYTVPYAEGGACIVVLANSDVNSPQSLQGKTVGVELATTMVDQAGALPGVKLKIFPNQQTLLVELQKKSVDAIVIDRIAADFYLNEAKMHQLKVVQMPSNEQFAMMARKGDFPLINKINHALIELKASGELKAIHDKWFNPKPNAGQ